MGKEKTRKLFLVNSGLPSKEHLRDSLLHPTSSVVFYDYKADTFDSVTNKIKEFT